MLVALKNQLEGIYATTNTDQEKEIATKDAFDGFRATYQNRRGQMGGGRFDQLVNEWVNNAYLVSVGTYEDWVPAFVCLFERSSGSHEFYTEVEELAAMTEPDRTQVLSECANEELDTSLL